MKRNIRHLGLVILLALISHWGFATEYYVNPTGSNEIGDGTSASPWKTIAFALSQIEFDQGHTLHLSEGLFVEDSILTITGGINFIGAGSDKTKITVNYYFDIEKSPVVKTQSTGNHYDPSPHEFVFQIDGDNITMKGFEMDGQDNKCHGGIRGIILNNATFDDIYIHDYNFSGLWMQVANNSEVKNSKFVDNAWGNGVRAFGNILYYHAENLSIHHNTIIQSDEYGSYGISAQNQERDVFLGGSVNHEPIPGTPNPAYLTNLKIYSNYIEVPERGSWNNFTAPSISVQINSTKIIGMEMYDNWLNNHISITPGSIPAGDKGLAKCRIHHNTIDMGINNEYRYAIEANVPDMEIDHNLIIGGLYPIAQWEKGRPVDLWENHHIHHNVFYGTRGGGSGANIVTYQDFPRNFRFNNNTIYELSEEGISQYFRYRTYESIDEEDCEISNNIFMSLHKHPEKTKWTYGDYTQFTKAKIENNLFYNTDPFGFNSVIVDSTLEVSDILKLSGDKPAPFFELTAGSPAIDAGSSTFTAEPYHGVAPDIGAFEVVLGSGGTSGKISFPIDDTEIPVGSTITASVEAEGNVAGVELFLNGNSLGTIASAPYEWIVTLDKSGLQHFTAEVTSNEAIVIQTPEVTIETKVVDLGAVGIFNASSELGLPKPEGSVFYTDIAREPYKSDPTVGELGKYYFSVGGGDSNGDTKDRLHYLYNKLSENATLSAKIEDLTGASTGYSGVMIRESLDIDARFVMLALTQNGIELTQRDANGAVASSVVISGVAAPCWVQLKQNGSSIDAAYSTDGTTWNSVSSPAHSMGNDVYFGLAASSQDASQQASSVVSDVKLRYAPVGEFPNVADFGTVQVPGFVEYTDEGKYLFTSEGKGIFNGTYIYKVMKGDFSMIMQVEWIQRPNGKGGSNAGILVVDPSQPNDRHAFVTRRGDRISYFRAKDQASGVNGAEELRRDSWTIGQPWIRLERKGTTVKMYLSDNKETWTQESKVYDINLPDEVWLGIAVNSDQENGFANARLSGVDINLDNIDVALTSPDPSQVYNQANGLELMATATHMGGGAVEKVEFYKGQTKIGEDLTAPYSFNWSDAEAGMLALSAKAFDTEGNFSDSEEVIVEVLGDIPASAEFMHVTSAQVDELFPDSTDQHGSPSKPVGDPSADRDVQMWKSPFEGADREAFLKYSLKDVEFNKIAKANIRIRGGQHDVESEVDPYWIDVYACENTNWSREDLTWNIAKDFTIGATPIGELNLNSFTYHDITSAAITDYIAAKLAEGAEEVAFKFVAREVQPWNAWMGGSSATFESYLELDGFEVNDKFVELTAPIGDEEIYAGEDVTLSARVEAIVAIDRVEFYAGDKKVGETTSAPYSVVWEKAFAGDHAITAKAIDINGGEKVSEAVSISVIDLPEAHITPVEDAHVRGGNSQNKNFGSATDLYAKGDYNVHITRQGYVKFALDSIPATIGTYRLALYVDDTGGESVVDRPVRLHYVADDTWSEDVITWNTKPAWAEEVIEEVTISKGQEGMTFYYDITDEVLAELAGDKVLSLVLVMDSKVKGGVKFGSSESANPPRLEYYAVEVRDVAIDKEAVALNVGDTSSVSATISPAVPTNPNVIWSNSNPAVASLDENGKVTALAWGETVITATTEDGGFTDEVVVSVTPAEAAVATVIVNQRENSGVWNSLGFYNFRSGLTDYVRVRTDNTNGYVIADAIKFSREGNPDVIVDSEQLIGVLQEGAWIPSSSTSGYIGDGYLHDANANKGEKQVTFIPNLPLSGEWEVSMRWSSYPNRATNVPVDIYATGDVNQASTVSITSPSHGQTFVEGATVTIETDAVDAMKVKFYEGMNLLGEATSAPFNFNWENAVGGNYSLSAKVTAANGVISTTDAVQIRVLSAENPTATVYVNERANGGIWYFIGTYNFSVGSGNFLKVRTDGTNGYVFADGFKFTKAGEADIIVDSEDASGVTMEGSWNNSTSISGYIGSAAKHDGNSGKGEKSVTYNPNFPTTGEYAVYMRWPAYPNRASNVPVDIFATGDATGSESAAQRRANGGLNIGSALKAVEAFTLYPNPSSEGFFVEWSGQAKAEISIFNTVGSLIHSGRYQSGDKIQLEVPGGLYLIRAQIEGQITERKLLIK